MKGCEGGLEAGWHDRDRFLGIVFGLMAKKKIKKRSLSKRTVKHAWNDINKKVHDGNWIDPELVLSFDEKS